MTPTWIEEMRLWDEPEPKLEIACITCGEEFCDCAADPTDPWEGELVVPAREEEAA